MPKLLKTIATKTLVITTKNTLLLFILLSLILSCSFSNTITGKVIKVRSGDMFTILSEQNERITIRLHGIDSPALKQAYGPEAKEYTSSKIAGKTVTIKPHTTNGSGLIIGTVFINGSNLSESIIADGYGWVSRKYCAQTDCKSWLKLEKHARSFYFGLWIDPNPRPPWEWVHMQKNSDNNCTSNVISGGTYHGNVQSRSLHDSCCQYYNCKNCTEAFMSVQAGMDAGYRPHKQCIGY
jgi:endonuclease YncB( thermonuclease family)